MPKPGILYQQSISKYHPALKRPLPHTARPIPDTFHESGASTAENRNLFIILPVATSAVVCSYYLLSGTLFAELYQLYLLFELL